MASYPRSSFRSFVAGRCPRCHQGALFSAPITQLSHFAEMPAACPRCGMTYEPEPGFYYGAMFISYGFSVAILLLSGAATYYFGHDPALWVYVTATTIASVLLVPVSYRSSRAIMLYLFGGIDFDPTVAAQVAAGTYQIPEPRQRRRRPLDAPPADAPRTDTPPAES